jgi:hypothetical protein
VVCRSRCRAHSVPIGGVLTLLGCLRALALEVYTLFLSPGNQGERRDFIHHERSPITLDIFYSVVTITALLRVVRGPK